MAIGIGDEDRLWMELRGIFLEEGTTRPTEMEEKEETNLEWLERYEVIRDYLLNALKFTPCVLGALERLSLDIKSDAWEEACYRKDKNGYETLCLLRGCLRILQDIYNRTRFYRGPEVDKIRENFAAALVDTGDFLLCTEWSALAGQAFKKAYQLGDWSAGTRLVGMVMAGETEQMEDYPPERLIDLLWAGVQRGDPDSLVYMALVMAMKLETPEDWFLADDLVSQAFLRGDGTEESLEFCAWKNEGLVDRWCERAEDDDLYACLALVWLERHGFKIPNLGRSGIAMMEVQMHLPHAPSWLFEPVK